MIRNALSSEKNRKWLFYLFAFLSAKATAFLGPISIAYLSDEYVYGVLELAFGYGLLFGPLLTLGVVVASSHHMLIESDQSVLDRISISVLCATAIGMGGGFLIWQGDFGLWNLESEVVLLVCLMVAPAASQLALSTYSRTKGWKSAAAWLDNSSTHLMCLSGLILFTSSGFIAVDEFIFLYAVVNVAVVASCLWMVRKYFDSNLLNRYRHSLSIGMPMMANGVAIFMVTGSSRVLIGSFLGAEDLASYAFLFRVTGAILLIHQFLMTAWAVEIYREDSDGIDRRLMWFSVLMSLAGLVVFACLLSPAVQAYFPEFVAVDDPLLTGLIVCQVLLWSQSAGLEPRVNRLLKAGRMALLTLFVAAAMISAIGFSAWLGVLGLKGIIAFICLAEVVLVGMQLWLGKEKGDDGLVLTSKVIFIGPIAILALALALEKM